MTGKNEKDKCGKKVECYSRVTGFYRPIQNYNPGKLEEFKDRVKYDINKVEEDVVSNIIEEELDDIDLDNS